MLNERKVLIALVGVGIAAFFYGIYYYTPQLLSSPSWQWIFIIDSPLYALLLAAVFFLSLSIVRMELLNCIASIGALKAGLWTVFVLFYYGEVYFSPVNLSFSLILLLLHVGECLEGLLFLGFNFSRKTLLIAGGWFLANDFLDYVIGTHPLLPPSPEKLFYTAVFSFVLTIFSLVLFYIIGRKRKSIFKGFSLLSKLSSFLQHSSFPPSHHVP